MDKQKAEKIVEKLYTDGVISLVVYEFIRESNWVDTYLDWLNIQQEETDEEE